LIDVDDGADRILDLDELRRRITRLEGARRSGDFAVVGSGCAALDAMLPDGGVRSGSLIEWISAGEGVGTHTLALLTAREACRNGGLLVALDRRREFCPPAVVRLGIDPEQLMVVHPENAADHDWAMDQVLRSPAVAAVVAWPDRLNGRTFRRWQLAAEEGECVGLLLRAAAARSEPSWADVRLWVESLPTPMPRPVVAPRIATAGRGLMQNHLSRSRLLRMVLLRCRGAVSGRSIDVELDDETYCVHPIERERLQKAN
jgi:protein ImuA